MTATKWAVLKAVLLAELMALEWDALKENPKVAMMAVYLADLRGLLDRKKAEK